MTCSASMPDSTTRPPGKVRRASSGASTANFFNPLVHHIERMVIDNRAAYPPERTLLTSGMVIASVESLYRKGEVIQTPEMDVRYTVPKDSLFWQD